MTDRHRHPQRPDSRRLPADAIGTWRLCYLVLTLLSGLLLAALVSSIDETTISLSLVVLGILILSLRYWTGALLLVIVQVVLYYLEPPFGLAWVVITLGLLVSVSRFRSLSNIDNSGFLLQQSREALSRLSHPPTNDDEVLPGFQVVVRGVVRIAVILAGCAAVSALIMQLVPLQNEAAGFNTVRDFALLPKGFRVLMTGLLLFILFLPVWLVVNEVVWRRLSAAQARIYLRSVLLKWSHRDIRLIVKKRLKYRRARVRAMKRAEPTTVQVNEEEEEVN